MLHDDSHPVMTALISKYRNDESSLLPEVNYFDGCIDDEITNDDSGTDGCISYKSGNLTEQINGEIIKRKILEKRLERCERERELLIERLVTAQEVERKRVASELHDGVCQSLSAIKYSIEKAIIVGAVSDVGRIKGIISMVQEAAGEVRRVLMNLRPPVIDDFGVVNAISWLCHEFSSVHSDINVDVSMDVSESDMSEALETSIYRIAQESLNNIAKHAKSEHVRVILRNSLSDSVIELIIQDDGVGFDVDSLSQSKGIDRHFGIVGIKERAEICGGKCQVLSYKGRGTTVHAVWPCT